MMPASKAPWWQMKLFTMDFMACKLSHILTPNIYFCWFLLTLELPFSFQMAISTTASTKAKPGAGPGGGGGGSYASAGGQCSVGTALMRLLVCSYTANVPLTLTK